MERLTQVRPTTLAAFATAQVPRKSSLNNQIRMERVVGVVLWMALLAVLFHVGH